jgi:coxsackievirus/adenovirus receptor
LKEAQSLLDRYDEEEEGNNEEIRIGNEQLELAKRSQQRVDELLAEADAAKDKAIKAVELGDKTLKDAQETYSTLEGNILTRSFRLLFFFFFFFYRLN